MKELNRLYKGLISSNILIMKEKGSFLECSFLKGGLVQQVVLVKDQVLSAELRLNGNPDILEGDNYHFFRNNFTDFSLHVKAKRLYLDLRFTMKAVAAQRKEVVAA